MRMPRAWALALPLLLATAVRASAQFEDWPLEEAHVQRLMQALPDYMGWADDPLALMRAVTPQVTAPPGATYDPACSRELSITPRYPRLVFTFGMNASPDSLRLMKMRDNPASGLSADPAAAAAYKRATAGKVQATHQHYGGKGWQSISQWSQQPEYKSPDRRLHVKYIVLRDSDALSGVFSGRCAKTPGGPVLLISLDALGAPPGDDVLTRSLAVNTPGLEVGVLSPLATLEQLRKILRDPGERSAWTAPLHEMEPGAPRRKREVFQRNLALYRSYQDQLDPLLDEWAQWRRQREQQPDAER